MEWLGFFMLGFVSALIACAGMAVSFDRKAAKNRIWQCDGKIYRLTEIDPAKVP